MKKQLLRLALLIASIGMFAAISYGQGTATGSISGTVTDPKGAVVAGANIVIKNAATNQEFTTQTSEDGNYRVPSLSSGIYTVTVTAPGFKQTVVTDIKVDVGSASRQDVQLQIGGGSETVTVVGTGELIRTDNATVGTTLTGRQITDLPTASRDALDLVLNLPGTTTPGRPRTSSVNGLPKGTLNISIDGVNVQDNLLRSNDGFFTYVRPRTDAVSEVNVSTSNPGAESAGEGAVQIKFVTQNGTNEYHGGGYWYHRNPALNANYWFNNRNLRPLPGFTTAPHSRILLNQPGGKIGGPIRIPKLFDGRDKAFFFVNYEEFRLPEQTARTRTVLLPSAQSGLYRYQTAISGPIPTGCVGVTATQMQCEVNLYTIAGNAGLPNTVDPTVGALLTQIRTSIAGQQLNPVQVAAGNPPELNRETVSFVNPGGQVRKFPTVRFDFEVSKRHHIENIWNYQQFRSTVDFLNNVDPAFPGFPNSGSQDSNRFSNATGWRWTVTNNIVNEMRLGILGGTSLFFSNVNAGQFANQGVYNLGIAAANISSATATAGPSRRNTPVKQFTNTLTWVTGNHSFAFGGNVTRINSWIKNSFPVAGINFGVDSTDPAAAIFTTANFPNASVGQINTAAALYAVLTGRVTGLTGNGNLNEETNRYEFQGDVTQRSHQTEYGIFAQDTWRVRPNFTLTGGLRYEVQLPFIADNSAYSFTTYEGLFGISGVNNVFRPGVLEGTPTTFNEFTKGSKAYNSDTGFWAPSIGFTYSPNVGEGFLKKIFGSSGQTVLRGGFSVATVREGINTYTSILGANPGLQISGSRLVTNPAGPLNLPVGTLLRNGRIPTPTLQASPVYPSVGTITNSANAFAPDLEVGYVESFTFGIQRELTKDTVFEARYVGNRGHKLWRQYNLNEINAIENGFANEFRLAQQNLLANIQCGLTPATCTGGGLHFRYRGPGTGTNPLPIFLANIQGATFGAAPIDPNNPAHYTAANFANATFVSALNPLAPNIFGILNTVGNNQGFASSTGAFRNNRAAVFGSAALPAGLRGLGAPNFFLANPDKLGGAFVIDNGGQSWYDALQLEVRRRLSRGLLVQANYVLAKAQTNAFASSAVVFSQPPTLRDTYRGKSLSPFDISHAFKVNFIYELPVGKGQTFFGGANGILDKVLGGWGMNGTVRWQSGAPISFGNVQLVGMTAKELQDSIKVRKEPNGVFFLPDDIITNSAKAAAVNINASGPFYTNGAPTGRYIAPAGANNCIQRTTGECGFNNLVLKGPQFFRADLSLVKKIRFTERWNLELRGEFLNAFNNANFLVGSAANDVNTGGIAGTITNAYQDLSTTNDPGGRLVQIVVRINF